MKKPALLIGGAVLGVILVVCCGGFVYWGIQLNVKDARRQYAEAEAHFAAGRHDDAERTYLSIKKQFLTNDEQNTIAARLREIGVVKTKKTLEEAHAEWAAGRKDEAVTRYRKLTLEWLDKSEQEIVRQRIREVDTVTARFGLEAADKLWDAGENDKALAKYQSLRVDLLDSAEQLRVTRRLVEHANRRWDDGWKGDAAAVYRVLQPSALSEAELATVTQRVKEAGESQAKYEKAELTAHGRKVLIGRIDLYYTSAITTAEAIRLGDFLALTFKNATTDSSVQITRQGATVQYRMVVKKGADADPELLPEFQSLAVQLWMLVFPDQELEVHLCDEHLKTLRVVKNR